MVEVLQGAIKDLPDQYGPYEMLVRYQLAKKEHEKAIQLLDEFIKKVKKGPASQKAKLFLASIYYQDRKLDDAQKLLDSVLKENQKDIVAHNMKGDILIAKRNFVGAIGEYKSVLQDEPQNIAAMLNLAKAYLSSRENELAEETYKKVLGINPKVGEALIGLGDIALAKKEPFRADKYYVQLIELEPRAPIGYYKRGIVKTIEKKNKEATSFFEKALDANANYEPALAAILDLLIKDNKFNDAIRRTQQQITKSPKNPDYYLMLGRLYSATKDFSSAHKTYENALEISPNNQGALLGLAQLEQSLGSLDKAMAYYQKMKSLNPNNPEVDMLIAGLLEQKGEPGKAKAIYEEILVKNPGMPQATNNLVFFLAEHEPNKDNIARAEKLITPLLERFKNNPFIVDTGAWVYYRKGEYSKARDLLLNIDEKLRNNPSIHYHMGMIYLRLGEKDKAKAYLQLALKNKEKFSGREEAEKELKNIR
jgi:tetratricopeptide (TPR) repeat protein